MAAAHATHSSQEDDAPVPDAALRGARRPVHPAGRSRAPSPSPAAGGDEKRPVAAVRAFAVRTCDGGGTRAFVERVVTGRRAAGGTSNGTARAVPCGDAAEALVAVVREAVACLPQRSDGTLVVLSSGPGGAAARARTLLATRPDLAALPDLAAADVRVDAGAGTRVLHDAAQAALDGHAGAVIVASAAAGMPGPAGDCGQERACCAAVAVVLAPHTRSPGAYRPLAVVDVSGPGIAEGDPDEERNDRLVLRASAVPRPERTQGDVLLCPRPERTQGDVLLWGGSSVAALEAVAAAVAAVHHGARPRAAAHAEPWLAPRRTALVVLAEDGALSLRLRSVSAAPEAWAAPQPPDRRLYVFSGAGTEEIIRALGSGRESRGGPARLVVVAAGHDEYTSRVRQARRWLSDGRRRPRPPGVYFQARPLSGDLAFVFPNGAAAYPGMGRQQLLAFPRAVDELRHRGDPEAMAGWAYSGAGSASDAAGKIYAASFLSMVHAHISREVLGLRPQAVLGYSSGEISALLATGVWPDAAAVLADTHGNPLFDGLLTRPWRAIRDGWRQADVTGTTWTAHLVGTDPQEAAAAVRDEPGVHLLTVNAPSSCTLGGEAEACRRVLARLPHEYAMPLDYDIAVHTPMAASAADRWRAYFHRPVRPVGGVRFYTCAGTFRFDPTPDGIAEASVAQALGTIDFPGAVERAWADGVRVFVEHGPKERCTQWIREILGDRPHLALALDPTDGRGLERLLAVCAELVAAGVTADDRALLAHLAAATGTSPRGVGRPHQVPTGAVVRGPAASPAVVMAPAPPLPPPDAATGGPDRPAVRAATRPDARPDARPDVQPPPPGRADDLTRAAAAHAALLAQHRHLHGLLLRSHEAHAAQGVDLARGPRASGATAAHGVDRTRDPRASGATEAHSHDQAHNPRAPGATDRLLLDASGHVCLSTMLQAAPTPTPCAPGRSSRLELILHGPLPGPGERLQHRRNGPGEPFQHVVHGPDRAVLTLRAYPAAAGSAAVPAPSGPPYEGGRAAARFSPAQVRAFHDGRPYDCFDAEWTVATRSHVRTPRGGTGDTAVLHHVPSFDPYGGPHGLGHLSARLRRPPALADTGSALSDTGGLPFLLEGVHQALAFHLTALGLTRDRDGWRFQPLPGARCVLQHTPGAAPDGPVTCEATITAVDTESHEPRLRADVVCTSGTTAVLRAQGVALQLAQDWPLEQWRRLAAAPVQGARPHIPPAALPALRPSGTDSRALVRDGLRLDHASMLAAAWGRPSDALGPAHLALDRRPRVIRLPAPPYQCLTRITRLSAAPGAPAPGSAIESEYDIAEHAWFRDDGNRSSPPPAVLLEAALQPCGWLAQYTGAARDLAGTPVFRNLDGEAQLVAAVPPGARVLTTRATLREHVNDGTMALVFFDLECTADGVSVLTGTTGFGFFPPDAFATRTGLPGPPPLAPDTAEAPIGDGDLTSRPRRWFSGRAPLTSTPLLMLDRLTGYWPQGGRAGLGRLRAEKRVDPGDWYFAAHFFQDPVQPGSLGVEAMYQLLHCHLIQQGTDAETTPLRTEPVAAASGPLLWKYRGQVTPTDSLITVDVDITGHRHDAAGLVLSGDGWLHVDGTCIYHATGLALRLTEGPTTEWRTGP
ncbi:hypothetical protein GPA10_10845 [Streptomyces sp. p1417]|uniref:Malonyl-CoA:ACP transacylase (MAT) domain-containing protein n=1 Tax=Streptomyces typhae TaxID=2681492 RepID=A0A6L6WU70_9ACTN|nr:hypothetical protein [Streptomyces typhae]MVO85237.1 hypothetical protein [Streptomyces typhae]